MKKKSSPIRNNPIKKKIIQRKKREDSLSNNYYFKEKGYKGRKRDNSWNVLKEARELFFGILKNDRIFDLCFDVATSMEEKPDIVKLKDKAYDAEEIKTMSKTFSAFDSLYDMLVTKIEDARKNKNTLFLNTVKYYFRHDPNAWTIDNNSKRGRKISNTVLRKRVETAGNFLRSHENKTFNENYIDIDYDRDKETYLCWLTGMIDKFLTAKSRKDIEKIKAETEIYKHITEIYRLMEKHFIRPSDIGIKFSSTKLKEMPMIRAYNLMHPIRH